MSGPMCYFITLILPKAYFAQINRSVHQVYNNADLSDGLRPTEVAFRLSAECDCGTALGSLERQSAREHDARASIQSLRRKGWSESKIQRWLQQKQTTAESKANDLESRIQDDLDHWCRTLKELITETGSPSIGLLLYFSTPKREQIRTTPRVSLPLDDRLASALSQIKEDIIYDILAPRETGRRKPA